LRNGALDPKLTSRWFHPSAVVGAVGRPCVCIRYERRSSAAIFRSASMVCHITEGELQVEQEGKTFTAKKNYVWTCNKDTKEQVSNVGNVVAIMRITDLKA